MCEPACNGYMNDEHPEHLDKHNESHKLKEKTKIVDGPEVTIFKGLGKGDCQQHAFRHEAEGSFKCMSCEETRCGYFIHESKQKYDKSKHVCHARNIAT